VRGRVEDLGVADVGAVEEREEVDGRAEGQDPDILLEEEPFLGARINGFFLGERLLYFSITNRV
jgi:hypothetical protein